LVILLAYVAARDGSTAMRLPVVHCMNIRYTYVLTHPCRVADSGTRVVYTTYTLYIVRLLERCVSIGTSMASFNEQCGPPHPRRDRG